MAHKSEFCSSTASAIFGTGFFKTVGDDTIGVNWVILIFHIVLLLSLLIVIDTGLLKYLPFPRCTSNISTTQAEEGRLDDDVLAERQRILRSSNPSYHLNTDSVLPDEEMIANDHLIVQDLKKHFGGRPYPAVNHLTFGAKRGEAFGLLGYNVSYMSLSLTLV